MSEFEHPKKTWHVWNLLYANALYSSDILQIRLIY